MSRRRGRIAGVVACLALALSLAACGDDDPLRQAVRGAGAIDDGYLSMSVRLVEGGANAGPPITFTLLGPFRTPRGARFARFGLEAATMVGDDDTAVADVRSTGARIGVTRHKGTERVADALLAQIPRTRQAGSGSRLPVVGFDWSRWIRDAQKRRDERAVGVATARFGGTVDVARLLGDVAGLLADAGSEPTVAALRSAQRRRAIAEAADWSLIDVWTGASDRLLRQISARIDFSFPRRSSPPGTARRATFEVHVRIDDVNERATH
jgi:hypothetical protein